MKLVVSKYQYQSEKEFLQHEKEMIKQGYVCSSFIVASVDYCDGRYFAEFVLRFNKQ